MICIPLSCEILLRFPSVSNGVAFHLHRIPIYNVKEISAWFRPRVKDVFVIDHFQAMYLNYTELRAYLYLIENGIIIFVFGGKGVLKPSPAAYMYLHVSLLIYSDLLGLWFIARYNRFSSQNTIWMDWINVNWKFFAHMLIVTRYMENNNDFTFRSRIQKTNRISLPYATLYLGYHVWDSNWHQHTTMASRVR